MTPSGIFAALGALAPLFLPGLLAGLAAGALFFAGLGWGLRLALRRGRSPAAVLLPSAALRIGGLLAGGWAIAAWTGPWGAAGYGAGFLLARSAALSMARREGTGDRSAASES